MVQRPAGRRQHLQLGIASIVLGLRCRNVGRIDSSLPRRRHSGDDGLQIRHALNRLARYKTEVVPRLHCGDAVSGGLMAGVSSLWHTADTSGMPRDGQGG